MSKSSQNNPSLSLSISNVVLSKCEKWDLIRPNKLMTWWATQAFFKVTRATLMFLNVKAIVNLKVKSDWIRCTFKTSRSWINATVANNEFWTNQVSPIYNQTTGQWPNFAPGSFAEMAAATTGFLTSLKLSKLIYAYLVNLAGLWNSLWKMKIFWCLAPPWCTL